MRDNPIPNALSTKVLFPELGGARGALYFPAFPPLAWVHRGAIQWRPCLLSGSHVSYPSLPYPLSDYTHGAEFARLLAERILILDGAMGTMIQQYKLSEMDFRGERFAEHFKDVKGNNELISLEVGRASWRERVWRAVEVSGVAV